MEDEDVAPQQFTVDQDEPSPVEAAGPVIPNLWFVLSPSHQEAVKFNRNANFEFCPLCQVKSRIFYCCDCIAKGEFMHSNPCLHGDLAEKRLSMIHLMERKVQLATKVQNKIQSSRKIKSLSEEIKLTKQRIKYLTYVNKAKVESIKKAKEESSKLMLENSKRTLRLPQFGSKVGKIDQVAKKHLIGLEEQRLKVNQKWKSLLMHRRAHLNELNEFIFPIEFVDVESSNSKISDDSEEGYDIMAEMEDAMSTSYIHGRWITTSMTDGASAIQLDGEKQWKIVAPTIPTNDSLLYSFIASSETLSSAMISPLHTILAGLALTAQFLNQISSCLDIIYPKRLSLNDFSLNPPATEYQFVKKLTRLNINALHLCLCQNINHLKPSEALHNICQLVQQFQATNIAQAVPYKSESLHALASELIGQLDKLQPTMTEDVESENEEEILNLEEATWEPIVPNDMMVVYPAYGAGGRPNLPNSPSPPPHSYSMSTAGSFMSSWLRGFTSPTNSPSSPNK